MSLYYCSITGEPAENPVISKKTGHVYEKRVVEKYIDLNQTCPITNQPLTRADIIPLQVSKTVKPRPVNATGVPDMMTIFQSEWDSLMLEVHGLKQNLESVRQELSHALYQHDAACRVIARLTKERDTVRGQLAEIGQDGARAQAGMEEELPTELAQEIIERITQRKAELSNIRKERKKNKEYIDSFATEETIAGYKVAHSKALHSTTKPGITALDVYGERDTLLVTGGNDGSVIFYDRSQNKVVNVFEKNQRKITEVKFVPSNPSANGVQCLVSSEDGIGYLLTNNLESGELTASYKIDCHRDALVGCTVHPLSSLGIFSCRDGSFSYHDLIQGRLLSYMALDGYHLKTLKVHPDGHLAVLAGHDGTLRVWNILEQKQIAELRAHNGPIDSLNFSENGVNFATGSIFDKTVKLWDLRNLGEENFKLVDENSGGVVSFDQFGQVLAVGTTAVRLYNVRTLEEFGRMDEHKDVITSIQFGNQSRFIASVALDGNLNIYS